jgi:flagellar hook-basal body complex protein FliE
MKDMSIKPLEMRINPSGPVRQADSSAAADKASFGQWLQKSLEGVDKMQQTAESAAAKLVTGESKDIHGTMIAMQKANISMSLMLEVRNKIISAYDEIKRMQF